MATYDPLREHLERQGPGPVVLSYRDIECILGRPLPKSAYGDKRRQWWANTETHSQARAWLRANRKAKLDVQNDRVTFMPVPAGSTGKGGSTGLRIREDALEPAAVRLLQDVAEEERVPLEEAAIRLLNQAARRRRRETLDWFAENTKFSTVSSAELVRADRDAR